MYSQRGQGKYFALFVVYILNSRRIKSWGKTEVWQLNTQKRKKIAFNPAVELSYLSKENQQFVVKNIVELDLTPSHAQAIRMKELSRENRLDENVIYSIMTEEKANQKEKLSFKMEDINEYFPKNYTPREKSEVILKLLKGWAKRRNKEQER